MLRKLSRNVLPRRSKCIVNVGDQGVATIAMASPPVNTLNADLLSSIKQSVDQGNLQLCRKFHFLQFF